MKAKTWLAGWAVLVVAALGLIGYEVYKVDPYFHYHRWCTAAGGWCTLRIWGRSCWPS